MADAARIGGVGVQIVRDWVVRFSAVDNDHVSSSDVVRRSFRDAPRVSVQHQLDRMFPHWSLLARSYQFPRCLR